MATKTSAKARSSKKQKPRFPANLFKNKLYAAGVIALVAGIGIYSIIFSSALTPTHVPADNPGRGLYYSRLHVAASGPCTGLEEAANNGTKVACGHIDPGPATIDVRARDQQVDKDLAAQVAHDKTSPPLASDASPATVDGTQAGGYDVGTANSLSAITGRQQPCVGTGTDGSRVQLIYAYYYAYANRISLFAPGAVSIAQRTNAVMYNSSVNGGGTSTNGGTRQIKYVTDSACNISVRAVAISGDINSVSNIENQLKAKGFNSNSRKYLTWIDGGSGCGYGQNWVDSSPGSTNANNIYTAYAYVWHPCWNYVEPHELMHSLGTVMLTAPHHTKYYHCYDQHDIMCYDDGSGIAMRQVCTNSYSIWLYDCNHDDYFAPKPVAGTYIASHWNTANSSFLYP